MAGGGQNFTPLQPIQPSPADIQKFLQRHLDLLQHERAAELEESRLLLSSASPKTLELNGLALTGLGILNTSVGMGGKRLVELHRPTAYHSEAKFPPNTFRSGDVVVLVDESAETSEKAMKSKGKGGKHTTRNEGIDGVVVKSHDTKIVVAISRSRNKGKEPSAEDDALPQRCRLVKVANEVTWDRMERNLVRCASKLGIPIRSSRGVHGNVADYGEDDSSSGDEAGPKLGPKVVADSQRSVDLPAPPESIRSQSSLLSVLLALAPLTSVPEDLAPPPLPLFNPSLNGPQRDALSRALASRELHLIHGPPGTGKTTLLVELVLQLAIGRGERVLVTGSSNLAVDNLGIRLVAFGSTKGNKTQSAVRCCRIGHPARVLPALGVHTLDHLSMNSSSGQLLSDVRVELQSAYTSLATPEASSSAGNKSTSRRGTSSISNKRLTGSDRRKAWDEVRELRKELRRREGTLFTSTVEEANVVLTTLHGAAGGVLERSLRPQVQQSADNGTSKKESRKFDTIIIDEACQAMEASSWGAVLDTFDEHRGARLILAGDDQQLGPVVKSESNGKRGLAKAPKVVGKNLGKTGQKGRSEASEAGDDDSHKGAMTVAEDAEKLSLSGKPSNGTGAADTEQQSAGTVPLMASDIVPQTRHPKLLPPRSLELTLFTRLLKLYGSGPSIKSLLTVQYRMNETIMDFPNKEMYGGLLIAHESCKDRWLGDGSLPSWQTSSPDSSDELLIGRVIFYDTAGAELYESSSGDSLDSNAAPSPLKSDSKSNAHEVDIVKVHVQRLMSNGLEPSSITLLAPYSAQVAALASAFPAGEYPGIEIGTIDALQGREQDVVVISLVRSNEDGEVGFLSDQKRLNVAMTRAKRQLVVVGDSETIRRGDGGYLTRWMDWLEERAFVEPILP